MRWGYVYLFIVAALPALGVAGVYYAAHHWHPEPESPPLAKADRLIPAREKRVETVEVEVEPVVEHEAPVTTATPSARARPVVRTPTKPARVGKIAKARPPVAFLRSGQTNPPGWAVPGLSCSDVRFYRMTGKGMRVEHQRQMRECLALRVRT